MSIKNDSLRELICRMASNMQSFPRMLKMLRENSNIKEKREALTYIRRNCKKLESTKAIKEEQYKELCKLVVDAFANGNNDVQNEAYETLNVIIREFKDHTLNLFEAMSQISQKHRLKILKLLEVVEENAISTFAYDVYAVNFFNNCMCTINTITMPWTAPTACVDNLQALNEAESKPLSDDQRLEEETINYCVTLLRRLYKVAAITSDIKVQRFNALLVDKVTLLAYMGHKRQRGPALKLLQQALATKMLSHVRTKLAAVWSRYMTALQSTYCKRMLLLVSACELDWATQWNVSIQLLGVDLHRGASLINNLLSVEEKAFKSTDTIIRRQAFLSWKLLVDNFALDPKEFATARRIKLLCIPLNAKNSKTELIALTKLEVWWHVIIKLYKDISKFVNPVITQFLNFCFGPLGDTPLLSSKFDIVASPGKRFFKTKVVAVDALCQLLVTKQENHTVFSPILEERLPHSISDTVFQECYKSIIHSVGEALLVLSQLTDAEMKNRYQLGKILWTSLVSYVQESKMKKKETMYKDIILVITELANYAGEKPMIRNLILDIILFEIADLSKDFNFQDDTLSSLVFKLLQASIFNEAEKKHYDAFKCLFWHCIKSQKENVYYSHAFNCLKEMYEKLNVMLNAGDKNETVILELWLILADALEKYMSDIQEINEGSVTEHLQTVESIVVFPFMHTCVEDQKQVQELAKAWNHLYKQFEMRTDLITTVKSNEILLNVVTVMQRCLTENEKSAYIIIHCLDVLLSTINYKLLLVNTEASSIIHLIVDLVMYFLSNKKSKEVESVLKTLAAVIITVYGQNREKTVLYLQACKHAIANMLQSELETLYKQVASTWETVISIFKGLGKQIDYDLLSSYKKAIIQALNHPSLDIQIQTVSLFELRNVLSGSTKLILEEIEKETGRSKILSKSEIAKEKNDQIGKSLSSVKIVGNFLRGSGTPKLVKETDKHEKNSFLDADSQDYVLIKTDLKFDVNRLTEHQKECLKRRREDIPALYNDLSQSSSQDTQNLQEWFDKKSKILEETEKGHKKDNVLITNTLDDDANKENKIQRKELEIINKSTVESDTKSTENVGQSVTLEPVQKTKNTVDNNENSIIENQIEIVDKAEAKTSADIVSNDIQLCDNAEAETPTDFVSEDVNSNAQKEPLGNKDDQRLSPSVLDNGKRRIRLNTVVKSTLPESEEIVNNQSEQISTTQGTTQRMLRTKVIQYKPETANKQKALDNVENKTVKEDKRGIKRKATSESESDGASSRQRRKIIPADATSDSDSCKSTENDNAMMGLEGIIDESNLSQRTRNEISRLRINMVFDSPLSTSRRSKNHEDKDTSTKKGSPECRAVKLKVGDTKAGDSVKRIQKVNEKELKGSNRLTRKSLNAKKKELEEPKEADEKTKEEIIRSEVILKSVLDDNCDPTEINEPMETTDKTTDSDKSNNETQSVHVDQNMCDGTGQTQIDMEDIIEDSQDLLIFNRSKLQKMKKLEQHDDANKNEDTKKTSQGKKNELEGDMEVEKSKKEENIQAEIILKNTPDDKSDALGMEKSTKFNTDTANDDKLSSESENIDQNEGKSQIQDDVDDIIESSQELSNLGKKCTEKQCFIKINKIENVSPLRKAHEVMIEGEEATKLISNTCDSDNNEVPKNNVKEFMETNEVNITEPKNSTPIIENNSCDNEKGNDASTFKSLLEFSSPKSNIKRQKKFKTYSGQGRAAHMLGLVTKQARIDAECPVINLDEEPLVKRVKAKDIDNDTLLGKKEQGLMKEIEKVTATCSSRQEKIFNNMKSTDYCSSPSIKLFSNLKNDGEKIFSKVDKSVDCASTQTDIQFDKIHEESVQETDELPILEWSSANPPSLTASPSASILKRQRQSILEPDPESTPNKRKRVSFADPPVSKEMEYEITSTDSSKPSKFSSRGLLMRKDSPLRLKQTKQKLISLDSDKIEKDEEITTEVDLQCERENELLTKIAEELEYSETVIVDTDTQTSIEDESTNVSNACNKIKIENLNMEFEITQDSTFAKHIEPTTINKVDQSKKIDVLETSRTSNMSTETTEFDGPATQEDIFTGTDAKHNNHIKVVENHSDTDTSITQNTSINNTLDSPKINVGNGSIIEHSSEKRANFENLEDTVDAANLTVLNSSANSDEIFCGRLIRTSTQSTDNNMQEQDTLPVTDSVFASLPLSQDSQNASEPNIDPELLDSVHPIYPTLILCKEPITAIIDHLTNPLWVQYLSTHLTNRNIHTVGDLARLSEREVNRIPVKGSPKVDFVKGVLKCFEKAHAVKETSTSTEDLNTVLNNKVSCFVNTNVLASTLKVTPQDSVLRSTANETQNESLNNNILLGKSNCSKVSGNAVRADKNTSEMFEQATKSSVLSPCETIPQTTPSMGKSSNMITTQITNVSVSAGTVIVFAPETRNSTSSVKSTTSMMQAKKTVATCTSSDSIYLSKVATNKATKSVAAQMALEDLLDEIDVNLVLESAARRCSPEKLLMQYKDKMRHVTPVELESETIKLLGAETRKNCNEVTLKTACRACGVNKVLLRLPDIFSADKEFFIKVLNAYKKKIKTSDCLNILDFIEVKDAICQRCTSSELAEMLSKKLKEEEQKGIRQPMTEISSLDAMLKRMPMDVIISHTVANDELIPSQVVLDIALQNNSPSDIAQALESQSSVVTKNVFDKLWSSQFAVEHIDQFSENKEDLLKIFKAVSSKLSKQDLLQAFCDSMNLKLTVKQEED